MTKFAPRSLHYCTTDIKKTVNEPKVYRYFSYVKKKNDSGMAHCKSPAAEKIQSQHLVNTPPSFEPARFNTLTLWSEQQER